MVVDGLDMRYGTETVLRGISFEVQRGDVFALLGSNGAGKTTTVEILEGHRRRTGGDVQVLGTDPARGGRAFRDRLGIVLQSTAIDPDLTVIEAARLQASYHRDPLSPDVALSSIGLDAEHDKRVGVLSGGQRRRLDLALAIVGRPDLVFLDEPTTGFDPLARQIAWDLVDELRGQGVTIVLTTHYLDEVERLADKVAVLRDGSIAALGSPAQLVGLATEISFRATDDVVAALSTRFDLSRRGERAIVATRDPQGDLNRLTSVVLDNQWELIDLRVGPRDLESVFLELVAGGG